MTPIEFLQRFHPERAWVLTAIEPSQKGIETKAFLPGPEQAKEASKWIEENNKRRNLYFSVAEVIEPKDEKASLDEVKAVHWFHVDIDAGAGDLLEELKRIKELVTTSLPEGVPKPTIVVYSGGGYQCFWQLEEPIPIEGVEEVAREAGRYNKQLEQIFGGDSCHNVDRIMRLPGTLNIPNQRKLQKGRVPVEAEVVYVEDTTYALTAFNQAADVGRVQGADDVEISGNVQRLASVDDLDQWGVSDRVKVIIVQGRDPDQPKEGDDSRSAWVFDATCQMVRCGVPDEVIYSVLTDSGFKISESVLEASNSDRYAKKQIKSAKEAVVSEWLYRLNEKHFVIGNLGGACRVMEEVYDGSLKRHCLVKQSFADFKNRYLNQFEKVTNAKGDVRLVPVGKWWLEHPRRRQYDRLVFEPGRDIPDTYNLWRGFNVPAIPGPNHESFLAHIRGVICAGNDDHYDWLLSWLANCVQNPAEPGYTAVVLRGDKGTGKSYFGKTIGHLFGRHFLHVTNASHLVGKFNAHLRDAIVVLGDEAFYAGNGKHESVLKTLVTEELLIIERKGVDAETSPNYCHLILASNSDWVVPASGMERRWFVLDVSDDHAQDTAYFCAIQRDLDAGGYESLLHFLMHLKLSDFDPRSCPATTALATQKWATLRNGNPLAHMLGLMLDSGEVPIEIIQAGGKHCIHVQELADCINRKIRRNTVDAVMVRDALKRLGSTPERTARFRCWSLPSSFDLGRQLFEKWARIQVMWDEIPKGWISRI